VPTCVLEILGGRLRWREFVRSLRASQIESVFCREDMLPGVIELALVPYLSMRKGF
jgi:hypothetical protein